MPEGLVDPLMVTEARIASMAEGLRSGCGDWEDPIGEVTGMKNVPTDFSLDRRESLLE